MARKRISGRSRDTSGRTPVLLSRDTLLTVEHIADLRDSTDDAAISYAIERARTGVQAEEAIRQLCLLVRLMCHQPAPEPDLVERALVQVDDVVRLLPDVDQEPYFL
jgi:hypothetical protein